VVHPPDYARRVWRRFDAVVTCNPILASESSRFHCLPVISYGYPFPAGHGISGAPCTREQLRSRRNAVCQIVGAKSSLLSQELYSQRRSISLWFHEHSQIAFDVFGVPPMNVPNYRGAVDSKLETLQQYRYALCFENCHDPRWSRGYLTEKILDCFHASTVPVYLGCSNVEEYVPGDCFIDYRRFDGPQDLERFLAGLTEDDYVGYADRIWEFLDAYRPQEKHHADRLYETVAAIVREPPGSDRAGRGDWPVDYPNSGVSPRDRLAFHVSCLILRYPGLVKALFGVRGVLFRLGNRSSRAT
jgi:hypothetical protein